MTLLQEFRQGCLTYREQLLAGKLATAEEIAEQWPGSKDNPGKNLKAWAGCYAVLRGIAVTAVRVREHTRETSGSDKRALILDAIAEVPETVELMERDGVEDRPKTLTVYQKSDLALREIHKANLLLASLTDGYELLTTHGSAEDLDLVSRILAEQSYLQRLIVWITTTPGPGIPYPEGDPTPQPPASLASLSSFDFYGLAQAFQRVNVVPLTALDSSTRSQSRPDWSVFFSGLEFELKVSARALRRDRGLAGLVATASEHARARVEAQRQAKAGAA